MFQVGDKINVTMMEGGGTYTIKQINDNNTVDVTDEMGRTMPGIKMGRLYNADQPKPYKFIHQLNPDLTLKNAGNKIMKIKISKNQWQEMGKKIKTSQTISNPLNGKSKQSARNYIYKLVYDLTKGFFRDESWENVNAIWKTLDANNIPHYVTDAKYFNNERGESAGKTWHFEIPFTNNKNREDRLIGTLTAHFCGSVADPSDKYDISFII